MIESLLAFIRDHAEWAAIIVFVIAFAESMAVIGLLVPGWLLLVGVGTMIGSDLLSFYPILIATYLGAIIGENLSFQLGLRFHEPILKWPFVASHQSLIDKSHEFFQKHGIGGVFIGRFFGPTRALVPFIAGVSEMSSFTFLWVNLVSGLLWAPFYLIPGVLVGAAFTLESEQTYSLLLAIGVIVICVGLFLKYLRRYLRKEKSQLLLFKILLAFLLSVVTLILFLKSNYGDHFFDIMQVVWQKL